MSEMWEVLSFSNINDTLNHTHTDTHTQTRTQTHTLKLGLCIITNTSSRKKKKHRRGALQSVLQKLSNLQQSTRESFRVESCSWLDSSFKTSSSTKTGMHTDTRCEHPPHIQLSTLSVYVEPVPPLLISPHLRCMPCVGYALPSCAWHGSLLSSFSNVSPHLWRWGRCL